MSKETGGPAYARPRGNGWDESSNPQTGMTLRDYFAGQALNGMLAGNVLADEAGLTTTEELAEAYVVRSCIIADALIKELNK